MPEGIIDMADMETIFSVTDALGIHRESISVELTKENPGSVGRDEDGTIEITVPESQTTQEFSRHIEATPEEMGYTLQEVPEGGDEDEDNWL